MTKLTPRQKQKIFMALGLLTVVGVVFVVLHLTTDYLRPKKGPVTLRRPAVVPVNSLQTYSDAAFSPMSIDSAVQSPGATATSTAEVVSPMAVAPIQPPSAATVSPMASTPIQPSSATVVSPMASVPIQPGSIAPTTTANLSANDLKDYPPQVTSLDGRFWGMPAFPDYSTIPASRGPGHQAYLYVEPYFGTVTLWWPNVPTTVKALYFVYDQKKFGFGRQSRGVISFAGKDTPQDEERSSFSIIDMVTNPVTSLEGAVILYDKKGTMFKHLNGLDRFMVDFYNITNLQQDAVSKAVSFFYLDTSGKGNFLTLNVIPRPPPRSLVTPPPPPTMVMPASIAKAPTTLTTPNDALTVFTPVLTPETGSISSTLPAFPNYGMYDEIGNRRYNADVYVEVPKVAGGGPANRWYINVLWEDVPATVDALYFVYDRARFDFDWQGLGLLRYASQANPQVMHTLPFTVGERVTNPLNAAEGAVLLYDKKSSQFNKVGSPLEILAMEFSVDSVAKADAFLGAVSFYYVENGKGSFLNMPRNYIRDRPPIDKY